MEFLKKLLHFIVLAILKFCVEFVNGRYTQPTDQEGGSC